MTIKKVTTKDGTRWEVRVRVGGRGSQSIRRRFDRREDAELYQSELLRTKRVGGRIVATRTTLDEYGAEWWERAEPRLALTTRDNYRGVLKRYVLPRLGHVRLSALTPPVVSRFKDEMLSDAVGVPTLRYARAVLSAICSDALERGELSLNPVAAVRWPTSPRKRSIRALTADEVESLRRETPTDDDALWISLLAYAGLRPEEVLALEWTDVRDQVIVVDKAVTHGQVKPVKNQRNRVVEILGPLADDLAAHRKRLPAIPGPGALVFPHPRNPAAPWGPTTYKNWQRRVFTDAATRAGMPDITPYYLRHTFASLLLASGVRRGEVAEQLGDTIQTMETNYFHVIADYRGVSLSDPATVIREARASSVRHRGPAEEAR